MLFEPITLRGVTIRNRVWLPPMCQYAVVRRDGVATDWHLVHYGARAAQGFGLLVIEATGVVPEGRITVQDLGLWDDSQIDGLAHVVRFCQEYGAAVGVQLGHSGRKGSVWAEQPGGPSGVQSLEDGGFTPVGPTATPFPDLGMPHAMTTEEVARIPDAFAAAARRADAAGIDVVEIHAAHGYLLHQFYSPLSNTRDDIYGGDFDGRTRLLREVVEEVRRVWPESKPLFVRLSATEWVDDGWSIEDSVRLSILFREMGVDLMDVSTGGNIKTKIPTGPGYQVEFAHRIRSEASILTSAVGLITNPIQAEQILTDGYADATMIGREALRNPGWPEQAAAALNCPTPMAPSYARGALSRPKT